MSTLQIILGLKQLLRFPAIVTSSIAGMLISLADVISIRGISLRWFDFALMLAGVVILHGVTTHAVNDLQDWRSGTDAKSEGILSGGSRILPEQKLTPELIALFRDLAAILVLIIAVYLAWKTGAAVLLVLAVGIWSAYAYTEPPFLLAYRPLMGEWLGEFPAMVASSVGVALVLLGEIPLIVWIGAVLNALFCMGWLMQHHLPDIRADLQSSPPKLTTVAFLYALNGRCYLKFPSLLYFSLALLLGFWAAFKIHYAFILSSTISLYCIFLVLKSSVIDIKDITYKLKGMQLATLLNAAAYSFVLLILG